MFLRHLLQLLHPYQHPCFPAPGSRPPAHRRPLHHLPDHRYHPQVSRSHHRAAFRCPDPGSNPPHEYALPCRRPVHPHSTHLNADVLLLPQVRKSAVFQSSLRNVHALPGRIPLRSRVLYRRREASMQHRMSQTGTEQGAGLTYAGLLTFCGAASSDMCHLCFSCRICSSFPLFFPFPDPCQNFSDNLFPADAADIGASAVRRPAPVVAENKNLLIRHFVRKLNITLSEAFFQYIGFIQKRIIDIDAAV